ncbi:MAG: M56 family metallopeptidase, partial [Mycobacteriaceae bacterium]
MFPASVVVLGALTLLLVGPVPAALARARWPLRSPRAALVLWQSVALAGVLSAFGAGLATASRLLVLDARGHPVLRPTEAIAQLGLALWVLYVGVLGLTLVVGVRLAVTVVAVAVRTRRLRVRHRDLVDLLDAEHVPELHFRRADLRVLSSAHPVAYCLPGLRHRVVVSDTTLTALEPEELRAVLAHERAHLRARHDLVLEAFLALHTAFPHGVRSRAALSTVALLVELLADDCAVRREGRRPLARALVACAGSTTPAGTLAAGSLHTLVRVQRLAQDGRSHPGTAAAAYVGALAILVVPTVAVALPWLR